MRRPTRNDLERHVAELAELFGWTHHHTRRLGVALDGYPDGFPSETLVRHGRLVFILPAPQSGRLSRRETAWLEQLNGVRSVEAYGVRPEDLGEMTALLRGEGEPRASPAAYHQNRNVRPGAQGGRGKSHQAPTTQEEACEGPAPS